MKDYSKADKAATKEFGTGEGRPIQKIEINQPDAFPTDKVWFVNPRASGWDVQFGVVVRVETHWVSEQETIHLYQVQPYKKKYKVLITDIEQNVTRQIAFEESK